ncbi:hypothetical protein [Adhaeribacter aquaticus]|uniref:hypothetical protein n=1 Tax=Adhaeribacter aquaticus TaxID=299567 RepID=UPI0004091352|nr:hypothetical protein [Adhaeribacter aquaticus]
MGYCKEIEIEFDDLIDYIKSEGLSERESLKLLKAIKEDSGFNGAAITCQNTTIMDELAAKELQELITLYGADYILTMVRSSLSNKVA